MVRLNEARKHKEKARDILDGIGEDIDKEMKKEQKQEAKTEKQQYSKLKKLRWTFLTNGEKLKEQQNQYLQKILQAHQNLAVCYAMKEEMCRLYDLTDYPQAIIVWTKWFEAAKASGIPCIGEIRNTKRKTPSGTCDACDFSNQHRQVGRL